MAFCYYVATPNPLDRIAIDPNVCFGKPRIKGTRIWVSLILDFLAGGMCEAEILRDDPSQKSEDIRAAHDFSHHH